MEDREQARKDLLKYIGMSYGQLEPVASEIKQVLSRGWIWMRVFLFLLLDVGFVGVWMSEST